MGRLCSGVHPDSPRSLVVEQPERSRPAASARRPQIWLRVCGRIDRFEDGVRQSTSQQSTLPNGRCSLAER